MRLLAAAVLAMTLAACSDEATARRALTNAGYTDIQVGGWEPLWCGEDDTFTTTFTATNPAGRRVSGAVCSGWSKGATIRF